MDITKINRRDIQGQKAYELYIDNAVGYIDKTNIKRQVLAADGVTLETREEPPSETYMRSMEKMIDIPEQCADDFRRSVVAKWASNMRKLDKNVPYVTGARPSWKDDWAMRDAIDMFLKLTEHEPTITTINRHCPIILDKTEDSYWNHRSIIQTLGKPEFSNDHYVRFRSTSELYYYQDREEEVRSRTVKEGTKGRIAHAIPRSNGWHYAVKLEKSEAVVVAPASILQDKSWYDEEARRFNETDTYMDEEARSIAAGGGDFLKTFVKMPEKEEDYVRVVCMSEEACRDFLKCNTQQECTCSIDTLMSTGCKCGFLDKNK